MCQRHVRFHDEQERTTRHSCSGRAAIVLMLCLMIKLCKSPGQNNVMGSSVPFVLDEQGLTDSLFARVFAMGTLAASLVQPLAGRLLDLWGIRTCIPLGLCALAGGLTFMSMTAGPLSLFCSFTVIRATSIGVLEAWPSAAIAIYFVRFRGRAMALMSVCGGLPTGLIAAAMQARRQEARNGVRWRNG